MKRASIALIILVFAASASAAEKWWDFYNRGVNAVRAKNYDAAVEALQRSLAEMPNENGAARARNEIIVYVPHFWLGIAKFNLGDADAALREWKISEEQGVVQSTPYYAQLRDWVARAQSQQQHNLETAAAGSKRDANAAVGRAVSAQMDAVAGGADRGDRYRAAQRKLQDAIDAVAAAGTDVRAYRHAAEIAQQAHDQFVAAAAEAKQQRAAHPPAVARQQPAPKPEPKRESVVQVPVQPTQQPPPQLQPVPQPVVQTPPQPKIEPVPVPAPVVETPKPKPVEVVAKIENVRPQLETAYRAFAAGDLAASEQLLTRMLAARQSGEAYLLRGCARYTRAMLSRNPDLDGAAADFRAALTLNRALRLDRAAFSPKLVAFFEQVKRGV